MINIPDPGLLITLILTGCSMAVFFILFKHENKTGQDELKIVQQEIKNNQDKILEEVRNIGRRNEVVDSKYAGFADAIKELAISTRSNSEEHVKMINVLERISYQLEHLVKP